MSVSSAMLPCSFRHFIILVLVLILAPPLVFLFFLFSFVQYSYSSHSSYSSYSSYSPCCSPSFGFLVMFLCFSYSFSMFFFGCFCFADFTVAGVSDLVVVLLVPSTF